MVASYAVLSAIGRLNAQELGVAAIVYDPEAHYHEVRRKWTDINITHGDGRREVLQAAPRAGAAPAGEIARLGCVSIAARRPPHGRQGGEIALLNGAPRRL